MSETTIRAAVAADVADLVACAEAAYALYVPRMGRRPAPMLVDYPRLVDDGLVEVMEDDTGLLGFLVAFPQDDCLFVENVAIHPGRQGRGLGRHLMAWAEDRARAAGLAGIRLYTNEQMTETLDFYDRLGFSVVERRVEDGYRRIYLEKRFTEE